MKRVKTCKGYVIAQSKKSGHFYIFTMDEWEMPGSLRQFEWDADSLQECIDWIG